MRESNALRIVFPACAGMFPLLGRPGDLQDGFPRVRGDVPSIPTSWRQSSRFSPRARGCSSLPPHSPTGSGVFPACAGMFRPAKSVGTPGHCFPRVRGDVPSVFIKDANGPEFSPRARGCSAQPKALGPLVTVFPACAGMFPPSSCYRGHDLRFPRVRGDVP